LGSPIQNDQIYPILTPYQEYTLNFAKPLQLLAQEIVFEDPLTHESRAFRSQKELAL